MQNTKSDTLFRLFLLFNKNVGTNLSRKYSQKLLDNAKVSATDALINTLERVIQETADATGGFIGNKITDKIKSRKLWNRIIQKQLHMGMLKKYLKKDRHPYKKDRTCLMS